MSSVFSAIGFPVRQMNEYRALAQRAAQVGQRVGDARGRTIVRWTVGGGPEVWVQVAEKDEAMVATPFFATDDTYRIAITGTGISDDDGFEGWIDGWLNPTEEDEPYSGAFPLRVDLVNFPLVQAAAKPGAVAAVRLAVILFEASLYPDAAAYLAVQSLSYRPPVPSFTSSQHFGLDDPEADTEATALVTGFLNEARELTNPATGATFWWLRTTTNAVTLTLSAARELFPVDPQAGQVISGSGWVLGELLT